MPWPEVFEIPKFSVDVNEMMKAKPNGSLIKKEMDRTFALRRKEVVTEKPAITQIVQRWPALFSESQVCMPVLRQKVVNTV